MERFFDPQEIIVSKTDLKGKLTYANRTFCQVSEYELPELLGQPHSLIRHPDMPRGVFKFLWDRIQDGREIFAYVVNLSRHGDHYWVLAHVTPTRGTDGKVIGYHSNRRVPTRRALQTVQPLYQEMLELERPHVNPRAASDLSIAHLNERLRQLGTTYDELIFSLEEQP